MQGMNFYLITPNDPVQREVLEKVEMGARSKLMTDYHASLNSGFLTTIACVYYESIVRCLVRIMRDTKTDNATINFFDLFAAQATTRVNEDADKEGNINVKFVAGPATRRLIETGTVDTIRPEMWQKTIIADVQKYAANVLYKKHRLYIPKSDSNNIITTVAYVYFEFLIRTLNMMIEGDASNSAMINFLDLFELHIFKMKNVMEPEKKAEGEEEPNEEPAVTREKPDRIDVKIRPGMAAKLIIKDDHTTEGMGDDDDD